VPGPGTSGSANTGQLVNINTATVDELHQNLHISAATAQNIVNYRQQNGPFTSIDQLQLVVSKTIYNKIKGLITI
jgi:competence protein ComEA